MRTAIWLVLVALVLLHHDFWFWNDPTLIGGWMPIGMLYHILLSLVASAFWFVVVKCAWPVAAENVAPETDANDGGASE